MSQLYRALVVASCVLSFVGCGEGTELFDGVEGRADGEVRSGLSDPFLDRQPPNIVVMITDDQRSDAVGVVQRKQGDQGRFPFFANSTPSLDRIASSGVRFRNAFVVSSLCSPSRAAFLTGRYNHLNGVANNHTPFPVGNVTYATALKAAGYRTGYFGKWHMGSQKKRPGFDTWASFVGQGKYFDCPLLVDGTLTQTTGWVDDVTTTRAIEFIQNSATMPEPFLVVLGFKAPHDPHTPPARHQGLFSAVQITPPANANAFAPFVDSPGPSTLTVGTFRNYFRTIVGADDNVGRVLDAIDQAGITEDTVVVFASDNGFYLREHGFPRPGDGNKRSAYEESIRIPLMLRYPRLGLAAGTAINAEVLNIDLAPTLLELAKVTPPPQMQGRSWVPMLRGATNTVRDGFLYEYFFENGFSVPHIKALRKDAHKLVQYPGHAPWEQLFDLSNDPGEINNLASRPASLSTLRMMRRALNAEATAVQYFIPSFADDP